MAWTAPRTWVTSEVVTSSIMNTHVRDNLLEVWREIQYTEITAAVSPTSTTEASPNDVIAGASVTVLGTPLCVEFFTPSLIPAANTVIRVNIWEDSTNKGRVMEISGHYDNTSQQEWSAGIGAVRYTPGAGAKVFKARAWVSGGTGTVQAGSGGSGFAPAYLRVWQKSA